MNSNAISRRAGSPHGFNKAAWPAALVLAFSIARPLCPYPLQSEGPAQDPALALADHLFRKGDYDQAATEYQRYLFFQPQGRQAGWAYAQIALCLQAQGRPADSLPFWKQAVESSRSETQKRERAMGLVSALIAAGRDDEAELALLDLQDRPEADEREVHLYLGLTYIFRRRWAEAERALQEAFPEERIAQSGMQAEWRRLKLLLREAQSMPRRSPGTAKVLSGLLPGAGQLHSGDGWNALNALLLNAAFGLLVANSILDEQYLEAAVLLLYPLKRYYTGNIYNAGLLAEKRSRAVDLRYRRQILSSLQRLLGEGPL